MLTVCFMTIILFLWCKTLWSSLLLKGTNKVWLIVPNLFIVPLFNNFNIINFMGDSNISLLAFICDWTLQSGSLLLKNDPEKDQNWIRINWCLPVCSFRSLDFSKTEEAIKRGTDYFVFKFISRLSPSFISVLLQQFLLKQALPDLSKFLFSKYI